MSSVYPIYIKYKTLNEIPQSVFDLWEVTARMKLSEMTEQSHYVIDKSRHLNDDDVDILHDASHKALCDIFPDRKDKIDKLSTICRFSPQSGIMPKGHMVAEHVDPEFFPTDLTIIPFTDMPFSINGEDYLFKRGEVVSYMSSLPHGIEKTHTQLIYVGIRCINPTGMYIEQLKPFFGFEESKDVPLVKRKWKHYKNKEGWNEQQFENLKTTLRSLDK